MADAEIAQRITGDPNFRGPNGQFDHARFEQLIRQAGFTESRFVEEQRRVTLRRQIAQSISGSLRVPATMLSAINQFQNEKRALEYRKITLLALTPADIAKPEAVTDDDARKYYEQNKNGYGTPERRELHQMAVSYTHLTLPTNREV